MRTPSWKDQDFDEVAVILARVIVAIDQEYGLSIEAMQMMEDETCGELKHTNAFFNEKAFHLALKRRMREGYRNGASFVGIEGRE